MRRSAFLRVTTLLSLGAGCVHELRYLLAYGGDAGRVMDHEGHAYLSVGTPLLGVLVAAALAQLIIRALGATSGAPVAAARKAWRSAVAAMCLRTWAEISASSRSRRRGLARSADGLERSRT